MTGLLIQKMLEYFRFRKILITIGVRENFEVDLKKVKVAFFGDPFTFGHAINVEERYTNIFARHNENYGPNEVVSISYKHGFQPEHYEFVIRNTVELKPDLYVIGPYFGNDLYSDVKETVYDQDRNQLDLPYRLIQKSGQTKVNPITLAESFRSLTQSSNLGTFLTKEDSNFKPYLLSVLKVS